MLFSKSLRKMVLGLIVAASTTMGFAGPASAEVIFNVVSSTTINPTGSLNPTVPPLSWVSDSIGNFVKFDLSGSDFVALQAFTEGYLQFITVPTGPTMPGPELPLTGDFIITSGPNGSGTVLLQGTGTSTLTRSSDDSVTWVSTFQNFSSAVVPPAELGGGGKFDLEFTLTNKVIAAGDEFPQFTAFAAAGSFSTIPEPSTFALLGLGGLGLGIRAYRRRNAIAV